MLTIFKKNAREKALEFKKSLIIPQYEKIYNKAIQSVAEESKSLVEVTS